MNISGDMPSKAPLIFLMSSITDGAFSLLDFLTRMWRLLLDPLVFFGK